MFLETHFPTIHKCCLELGVDIAQQTVPMVPPVHCTCGGVVIDLNGRTNLPAWEKSQAEDILPEWRNLVVCAELMVHSGLQRHGRFGLHQSRDFPPALPVNFPTVLTPEVLDNLGRERP